MAEPEAPAEAACKAGNGGMRLLRARAGGSGCCKAKRRRAPYAGELDAGGTSLRSCERMVCGRRQSVTRFSVQVLRKFLRNYPSLITCLRSAQVQTCLPVLGCFSCRRCVGSCRSCAPNPRECVDCSEPLTAFRRLRAARAGGRRALCRRFALEHEACMDDERCVRRRVWRTMAVVKIARIHVQLQWNAEH